MQRMQSQETKMIQMDLEKFVNSHQVNLFLAGFSHLESLCAATAKAFGEGGHNRIFHTMGANNSLNGTTKTQIILSGTLQYFTVLVFSFWFFDAYDYSSFQS